MRKGFAALAVVAAAAFWATLAAAEEVVIERLGLTIADYTPALAERIIRTTTPARQTPFYATSRDVGGGLLLATGG